MSAQLDRRELFRRGARLAAAGLASHTVLGRAPGLLGDRSAQAMANTVGGGQAPLVTLPGIRTISTSAPSIITRAEWGADEARVHGNRIFHPLRKVVVHHTVTSNAETDPRRCMRDILGMHLSRDGGTWGDLGYHFVVDQQGRIYEGRRARAYAGDELHDAEDSFGRVVQGAHAGQWNPGTLGIALMGNFVDGQPTPAAISALVDLIVWKCGIHGLDPAASEPHLDDRGNIATLPTIIPHGDVRSTACPGTHLRALIPQIRDLVAARVEGADDADAPGGYWVLDREGGVFAYGDAPYRGSLPALRQAGMSTDRATAIAAGTGEGGSGYLVLDRVGGVFAFGDSKYRGSVPALRASGQQVGRAEAIDIAGTPSGKGYWVLDDAGGVFAFGGAVYHGSLPTLRQGGTHAGRAVTLAPTRSGNGYVILDSIGGVFTFGDAKFHGSVPSLRAAGRQIGESAAVDLCHTPSGHGYWILDRAGGVFPFGDARFYGSVPGSGFSGAPARRIVASPTGRGYLVLCDAGAVLRFGDAPFHGHGPRIPVSDLAVKA